MRGWTAHAAKLIVVAVAASAALIGPAAARATCAWRLIRLSDPSL